MGRKIWGIACLRRGLTVMLAAALAGVLLTGCGVQRAGDGGREQLVIGFDANYPPFGYLREDGNYAGFDLELAKAVCELRGWELVKKPVTWEERDEELSEGSIDCIWSGFTMNGREEDYVWSQPYLLSRQVVVVREESPVEAIADLKGRILAVQAASSALDALGEGEAGISAGQLEAIMKFESYRAAFEALQKDMVDAVVMDIGVAGYQVSYYGGNYRILDETLREEQYGVGFGEGQEELRDLVDESLRALAEDGTYEKLAEKYGLEEYLCPGEQKMAKLRVSFLKVGKADAIVLQEGSQVLLIDTGEDENGEEVLAFLEEQGITRVETMLITHFDKDHVGGADRVIEGIPVERVLQPDYEGDGKQYRQYQEALSECEETVTVDETMKFSLGGAQVTVYPSHMTESEILLNGEEEYDNDLSLVVSVTYGGTSFLFTGDAGELRIRELLGEDRDWSHTLLKMPHHGRYCAETEHLLEAVQPSCAVICCSRKNPADEEVLELLEKRGIETFLTMDGTVTAVSDGTEISVQQ